MTKYEMVIISLNAIAIIFSAVLIFIQTKNQILNSKKYNSENSEKDESRAPVLFAEKDSLNYEGMAYNMKLEADSYPNTCEPDFVVDDRIFYYRDVPEDEPDFIGPFNSLIIDVRTDKNNIKHADFKWIAFCCIHLRNIGYDLVLFEIIEISIYFKNHTLKLNPNKRGNNKLNCYVKNGDELELYISYIYNDDENRMTRKIENYKEFAENKLKHVGNNVFNCLLPGVIDAYEKLEFNVRTKNKYNEIYEQKVIISIDGQIYQTTYTTPIRVNSK